MQAPNSYQYSGYVSKRMSKYLDKTFTRCRKVSNIEEKPQEFYGNLVIIKYFEIFETLLPESFQKIFKFQKKIIKY